MSWSLFPHQVAAVDFLTKSPKHAFLWDEQRVGKTAPTIVASGMLGLKDVAIVTPVSGQAVWRQEWQRWDRYGRKPHILPWSLLSRKGGLKGLSHRYDLLIVDEAHYAKNPSSARTRRLFAPVGGLATKADRVWCLTGTPAPHDPGDMYPMLASLFPEALAANKVTGWPDVRSYESFRKRYCVIQMRRIGMRYIPVVIRGQNTGELRLRLGQRFLRRLQKDIGIRPAIWDTLPVEIGYEERELLNEAIDGDAVKRALAAGRLADPHLAVVRRFTGTYKAKALVELAEDFLNTNYGEKLVIAYWHKDVGDALQRGLHEYEPVRVDGSTPGVARDARVHKFQWHPPTRVFLAQIQAAGEAIDLSAACEMWFAESTFTPAQMAQMGARITNLKQKKQCLVRVAMLSDTIDEIIQRRLTDLAKSIHHALGDQRK